MQDSAGGDIHLLLSILADGEEQTKHLEALLGEPELLPIGAEYYRGVAQQLQCTFMQAISVAKAIEAGASVSRGTDRSDSPRSADESSGRTAKDVVHERPDMSKRSSCTTKKGLPRWTKKVRVTDDLESTPDDGYSWRKYGQKDILGAKFPRGYYRCTYRNAQGCPATKQVQRSDTDFSVFNIIYQGAHTCQQKMRPATPPPPAAAATGNPLNDPSMQLLLSFKNDLKVETEGLKSFHDATPSVTPFSFPSVPFHGARPAVEGSLSGGFSPDFVSPAASWSSYFSMPQLGDMGMGVRVSESELGEVVSAATASAAADPGMAGFGYPMYQPEFDRHLPFGPSSDLFK